MSNSNGPSVLKIAIGVGCGIILAPFLFAGMTCGSCALLAGLGGLSTGANREATVAAWHREFNEMPTPTHG